MDHLDEIFVEELYDALDNVEGNKPTQRLLAVNAYKNGVTQTELAKWHNTGQRTIYSWLKRLDIDEIHGRVLNGLETEVIERPDVAEDIMENYPAKCVQLCASDFLKMSIHDDLPFGLVILDHRIGIGVRTPETGVPRAFVDTERSEAREWAEMIFESYWDEATELERFNPKALSEIIEAMGM